MASVVSFYDTNDPSMVSADRHAVRGIVEIAPGHAYDKVDAILDTVVAADRKTGGFDIGMVGPISVEKQADDIIEEDFQRVLVYSLVIGLIILLLAFRAVVAAVIPLALALFAIFSTIGITTLVSHPYPLVDFYTVMVELMGLAVGIDYSLFILSRFRNERKAGRSKLDAIAWASNTTGRAVFYAGVTVVLYLAGLVLADDFTFISLALGAVIVVAIAVVGSLTLLPALLSILGDNVNRLRVPFLTQEGDSGWYLGDYH